MSRAPVVVVGLVLSIAGSGLAQPLDREPGEPTNLPPPPAEPPPPPPPPVKDVTVSISPLHLFSPLLELMGELRINDHVSAAAIAGVGRVNDANGSAHGSAFEIGGQGTYYVFQPFRGLHVGAEVLYVYVGDVNVDSTLTGTGLALGAFVGWKYIHRSGFSFVGQGGIDFAVVEASSSTTMESESKVFPLLNLNVGYSF